MAPIGQKLDLVVDDAILTRSIAGEVLGVGNQDSHNEDAGY
jgi:hypothetical protein